MAAAHARTAAAPELAAQDSVRRSRLPPRADDPGVPRRDPPGRLPVVEVDARDPAADAREAEREPGRPCRLVGAGVERLHHATALALLPHQPPTGLREPDPAPDRCQQRARTEALALADADVVMQPPYPRPFVRPAQEPAHP